MVKNRFVVEVADTHTLKGAITRLRNIDSVFDAYRVTPAAPRPRERDIQPTSIWPPDRSSIKRTA